VTNVICDIDGVIYRGDRLIEGSDLALRRLLESGASLLFATNNSTKTPAMVRDRILDVTGVEIPVESVVTSSQAAVSMLGRDESPVMVLGSIGITTALADAGFTLTEDPVEAAALLVGLDWDLDYDRLTRAADAIRAGARFIATNTDPTYPVSDGLLPGGGAMVAAVERTTGIAPEVAGKPHAPMRELIRARGFDDAWVIGDRVDTDIALARSEPGWRSILVGTGVTGRDEPHDADHVVEDLLAAVGLILGD
jgi:HAD superfamily hydrolase (TIGR01450 family)